MALTPTELPELPLEFIRSYREETYCLRQDLRISKKPEAIQWVNQRGFVYFWPIKDIELPSLWVANAGNRPVGDHDDPGHITWNWKDSLLSKKVWYYSKLLRKKATIISLSLAPCFYALTENYGSPESDYLLQYEEGRMTLAAKQLYEAILKEGPLNTVDLRKAANLKSRESDTDYNRGVEALQVDMKILPVGVAKAGAWKYAFIYDLVPHHFPDLPEQARLIPENKAREDLLMSYFNSLGVGQLRDAQKLFGWQADLVSATARRLTTQGRLHPVRLEGQPGDFLTPLKVE